jgi:hypothetical protein
MGPYQAYLCLVLLSLLLSASSTLHNLCGSHRCGFVGTFIGIVALLTTLEAGYILLFVGGGLCKTGRDWDPIIHGIQTFIFLLSAAAVAEHSQHSGYIFGV